MQQQWSNSEYLSLKFSIILLQDATSLSNSMNKKIVFDSDDCDDDNTFNGQTVCFQSIVEAPKKTEIAQKTKVCEFRITTFTLLSNWCISGNGFTIVLPHSHFMFVYTVLCKSFWGRTFSSINWQFHFRKMLLSSKTSVLVAIEIQYGKFCRL